jgi:truncated hemoglobin YjbI
VDSLYEAVAQALRVFRANDWIDEVGRGQTTISVVVRQPEVRHKVRVQDFERWLESQGRTPAEVSLKARLRELLGKEVAWMASEMRNRNR